MFSGARASEAANCRRLARSCESGAFRAESRNVGIWAGPDADAVHQAIVSLPAFPWIDARVTALATHPLEAH